MSITVEMRNSLSMKFAALSEFYGIFVKELSADNKHTEVLFSTVHLQWD